MLSRWAATLAHCRILSVRWSMASSPASGPGHACMRSDRVLHQKQPAVRTLARGHSSLAGRLWGFRLGWILCRRLRATLDACCNGGVETTG